MFTGVSGREMEQKTCRVDDDPVSEPFTSCSSFTIFTDAEASMSSWSQGFHEVGGDNYSCTRSLTTILGTANHGL